MSYTIQEIQKIVGGEIFGKTKSLDRIEHIIFDSRRWFHPEGSLFIAFKGRRSDGHEYISELYEKGVRNFMVSELEDPGLFPSACFLKVDNTLSALQQWASIHRTRLNIQVIGVTGSNGKTVIKEWLYDLCQEESTVFRSPLSYNSQIGVALSTLMIQDSSELAIIEAGISFPGEMEKLELMIKPSIGIFSYLGKAHNAGFQSERHKLEEKARLFRNANKIIYQADQETVHAYFKQQFNDKQLISWTNSEIKGARYKVNSELLDFGTRILIQDEVQKFEYNIPFSDPASIHNSIHCFICCLELGMNLSRVAQEMRKLRRVRMRLEIDAGANQCMLINDSYNADMDSFTNGLQVLSNQLKNAHKTLIISDFAETGISAEEFLQDLSRRIKEFDIWRIISVGESLRKLTNYLPEHRIQHFPDTESLFEKLDDLDFNKEDILIKGARTFHFERIYNYLSQLAHQAILEMDLDALRHNLNVLGLYLKPETKLLAVVKASAYGSGSRELVRHIERCNVDYLAVAFIEEGVELRQAGIRLPILVLNPDLTGFDKLLGFDLEPEIYSLEQLKRFVRNLKEGQSLKVHINIDSGMNRLGFREEELDGLLKYLSAQNIHVVSIFSHLVGSATIGIDDFTRSQAEYFDKACNKINKVIGYMPIRHLLNSNGIVRFPEFQYDMVRTGLALYGVSGTPEIRKHLEKVHSLKARISQIKKIKKGQSVGYERAFVADRDMIIGTVNIGYADGIPRNAGNEKYEVLVHQVPARIIGNICMDMFMIDLTGIAEVRVQDEVIIFNSQHPVEHLAHVCNTIPYEILSRISSRIKRVYVHSRI